MYVTAIPKGTLLAIVVTFCTYVGYGAMIGGCALNQASGNETEYLATINDNLTEGMLRFDNCNFTEREELGLAQCEFGTGNDQQVFLQRYIFKNI